MATNLFPRLYGNTKDDGQAARTQDNINGVLGPVAKALQNTPIMGAPPPAWIAPDLLNGFTNYGNGFASVGYHRDALGYVHMKGKATSAAGAGATTVVFVLAQGYRPAESQCFAVEGSGATFQSIHVDGAGSVTVAVAVAAGGTADFSLSFLAEQ